MSLKDLISPQPLPFDFEEWKQKPFPTRVRMLCTAWATQGYGAPVSVYAFYILKLGIYVGVWLLFCSMSENLGPVSEIASWWFEPEALIKAVAWSIVYENIGLGCGSGPLTARYFPPVAAFLHFLRPGTIKMPLYPGLKLPGGDKRTILDVLLFAAHIAFLIRLLIAPEVSQNLILPTIILLPILGLLDKTIFLSARAEHYFIALICFMFPMEAISGWKIVWIAIWFWAATSKLNLHFPSVIGVMISNSAVLRFPWLKKKLYKNYPDDLRPGRLSEFLAHAGTIIEYGFPLMLIFGTGGQVTMVALVIMFCFHLYITSSVPMAVPLEWNFIMVYGAFVLFGHHAETWTFAIHSPLLIIALLIILVIIPVAGNFFPRHFSFLSSMRYYAGNWAYSVWLFKGDCNERMDDHIVKAAPTVRKQLKLFYDESTADSLISKVIGFRSMHLHGRLLQEVLPHAVDNIDDYTWRDGELVAGVVLGWNFGDGHLHDEQLLRSIQKRCNYDSGELRCIFVESQPFLKPQLEWRIADAKDGQIHSGVQDVRKLLDLMPWPPEKN